MKNKIKITVSIPAYNASRFIIEAIESVLSQDCSSFELLITDDKSEDNTLDSIKKYRGHPVVRIFSNKKNMGVAATTNEHVKLARGRYISLFAADDIMLPGNLKRLSSFLDTHRGIGAVYADILILEIDRNGKTMRRPYIIPNDCDRKWDLIENSPLVNYPGSMVRKPLISQVGGFDESLYSISDWDLWLKLAEVTKFKYLKGEVYTVWRRHPNALTSLAKTKQLRLDIARIKERAIWRRYNYKFKF